MVHWVAWHARAMPDECDEAWCVVFGLGTWPMDSGPILERKPAAV